jgi:hypothetical protein
MKRCNISAKAVTNILNAVRGRMEAAQRAAEGRGPDAMLEGMRGGRPDLALGGIPQVAAVDQARNEAGAQDKRGFAEVNAEARALLAQDYQGTYAALMEQARALRPGNRDRRRQAHHLPRDARRPRSHRGREGAAGHAHLRATARSPARRRAR